MFVLMVAMTDYFRPPLERPPMSNIGFQHANVSVPVPPSKSGSFSNFTLCLFFLVLS